MGLYFNPAVSVYPFDSGSKEPAVLCKVPGAGSTIKQYVVPVALFELLQKFDGDREVAEAIRAYRENHPEGHSEKSLESLVSSFLVPKRLLIDPSVDAPPRMEEKRKSFLYIRLPLISPRMVEPVARAMGWMFVRPVFIAFLTLFITGHVVFYAAVATRFPFSVNSIRGYEILVVFALSTLAALIHELGHASALLHYKCNGAEIGWGLYLIYPVLYTDVSEAWRLKRTQRAVIDIAGMYFQCIAVAGMMLVFLSNPSQVLLCSIIIVDLEIASALNPFLRTDGYWLVTDLFGVHNLRQQSLDLVKRLMLKLVPLKNGVAPPAWSLNRRASIALGIYLLTSGVFSIYLIKIILSQVVFSLLPDYPATVGVFCSLLVASPLDLMAAAGALLDVLWRSLAVAGFTLFVLRLAGALYKGLRGMARHLALRGNKPKVAVEDLS